MKLVLFTYATTLFLLASNLVSPTLCYSGQEPSVTLTWSDFKDLVELYAKDDQRRAELLESKHPSQNLLKVQAKQEQVDILPLQGI